MDGGQLFNSIHTSKKHKQILLVGVACPDLLKFQQHMEADKLYKGCYKI